MMGSPGTDETLTAKCVALVVMFLTSMFCGLIPIKLSQWFHWKDSKENAFVRFLLCFGAGVLLCTTLIHVLPEVEENLENIDNFPDLRLPIPEFLMCVGFFTMYFIEECVHVYIEKKSATANIKSEEGHTHKHSSHSHIPLQDTTMTTINSLWVIMALAIHEIFEGLAIGLETSSSTVWYMFGAVSAHKLVIGFCIGTEFVTSGLKTILTIFFIFIFAVISPIGIAIGLSITEEDSSGANSVSVILQGLACGTLLYVIFFELLKSDRKSGFKQFFAILCGFVVMICITLIGEGE